MTDDELTELECVIDDYCREAVRRGFGVYYSAGPCAEEHCPLGAVAHIHGCTDWFSAASPLRLTPTQATSFGRGFDRVGLFEVDLRSLDCAFYAMGSRFRERVEAGECR